MIGVVALNPALDITHHVAGVDWNGVNRPVAVQSRAGGKGVNVARTLHALGQPVTLTGLAGGITGEALRDALVASGIGEALTPVAGESRRTLAVVDEVRGQTALFNEAGPAISPGEYRRFCVGYEKRLASWAAVVLSGSLPPGLPADAYAGLIAAASAAGVPAVLDTSGAALGYAAGAALVKPNLAELGEATGRDLAADDLPVVADAARELGAPAVVSLGARGLLAVGDRVWLAQPPVSVVGNPTGAGDAVVAGLTAGLVLGREWTELLRHATALGTATAASVVAGEFDNAEYQRLAPLVQVGELVCEERR